MPSIPSTGYRFYDFTSLDIGSNVIAEYVWIDGTGVNTRSKSRTLKGPIKTLADLPEWNYDGSSTYQACTENSEIILKPCAMYKDPFRGGENVIAICETYQWKDGTYQELVPTLSNFRHLAKRIFDSPAKDGENSETAVEREEPWYGIEQEYTLFNRSETNQRWPLGWPAGGFPGPQGPYYCSVGAMVSFGRPVMDAHYRACLAAGVQISGSNAEVMPGQWEYQVGPCLGIAIGDQMVVSRYLLTRVCEDFNLAVSFLPKPIKGDWNGAGCHTNFSTAKMRAAGGIEVIKKACDALGQYHERHIGVYGQDNEKRLTGKHETSSIKDFSYGVGNRGSSVRIPVDTAAKGMGYLEDRRPASNIDPYLVSSMVFDTCCCDAAHGKELGEFFEKFNATAVPPEDYSC